MGWTSRQASSAAGGSFCKWITAPIARGALIQGPPGPDNHTTTYEFSHLPYEFAQNGCAYSWHSLQDGWKAWLDVPQAGKSFASVMEKNIDHLVLDGGYRPQIGDDMEIALQMSLLESYSAQKAEASSGSAKPTGGSAAGSAGAGGGLPTGGSAGSASVVAGGSASGSKTVWENGIEIIELSDSE